MLYNKEVTELIGWPGGKTGAVSTPSSVTTIYADAFRGGNSLSAINVDADNTAFTSIDGVLYNKDVTNLIGCPGSKTGAVTIPKTVTEIGRYAFDGCSGLTSITCLANTPPSKSSTSFSTDIFENVTLYVPAGSMEAYKSASVWKKFKNIKESGSSAINNIQVAPEAPTAIYDLFGHRLAQPRRGLNIINGKKVLVK